MFENLKAMGAMAALLKDKDRLKSAGDRIKSAAAATRATGEGGAGAVRVTVDGKMHVLAVELQPALVSGMAADDRTRELAGNLSAGARNKCVAAAHGEMKVVLEKEAAALGLPGLGGDLAGLLS